MLDEATTILTPTAPGPLGLTKGASLESDFAAGFETPRWRTTPRKGAHASRRT